MSQTLSRLQQAAGRYATVSALLRGVTRMDLSCSYGTVHVLNAVVAGLPDVKQLFLELEEDDLCADMPILCSGLESLELYDGCCWLEALNISLSNASSLRTCTRKMNHSLRGGKAVHVRIAGHDAAASIVPSVDVLHDGNMHGWCLTISLGVGNTTRGMHSVASVTFKYVQGAHGDRYGEGGEDGRWEVVPVR